MWTYEQIVEIAKNKAKVMGSKFVPILKRDNGWGIVNKPSELSRNKNKVLIVYQNGDVENYSEYRNRLFLHNAIKY